MLNSLPLRWPLFTVTCGVRLVIWAALAVAASAAATRPNIVLILADDFGDECVTAKGGESFRTPHLDRLAAGGMRFERCHVQPLCTPTRVQLLTGLGSPDVHVDDVQRSRAGSTLVRPPAPELQDPCIYREGGRTYLLYSVIGERGIAIAELKD